MQKFGCWVDPRLQVLPEAIIQDLCWDALQLSDGMGNVVLTSDRGFILEVAIYRPVGYDPIVEALPMQKGCAIPSFVEEKP